jgi:hypothetical protein
VLKLLLLFSSEQISTKLARNVHWMVLYQICVFGANLKSNMAARVHNVFSLAEILKIFLSETTKSIVATYPVFERCVGQGDTYIFLNVA